MSDSGRPMSGFQEVEHVPRPAASSTSAANDRSRNTVAMIRRVDQVLEVAVAQAELFDLDLELLIDGMELLVDRLQLLFAGLELLSRRAELFVGRLLFLRGRLRFLDLRLVAARWWCGAGRRSRRELVPPAARPGFRMGRRADEPSRCGSRDSSWSTKSTRKNPRAGSSSRQPGGSIRLTRASALPSSAISARWTLPRWSAGSRSGAARVRRSARSSGRTSLSRSREARPPSSARYRPTRRDMWTMVMVLV